ncbi:hypothetical protein STIB_48480 [Streptomyces sp. IB2014 011-1]|nr:hypothetical protein STIB_48480 [Streptomyces sp. IB2014 011-1]
MRTAERLVPADVAERAKRQGAAVDKLGSALKRARDITGL